jgi:hypothetical protein
MWRGRALGTIAVVLALAGAAAGRAASGPAIRSATLDYGPWVITSSTAIAPPTARTITVWPRPGDTFVSVVLSDASGLPEPAWIGQDVDGDGHPDASVPLCGASRWVPIGTDAAPVVVEIAWQPGAVAGCPLVASVGGVARFGFLGPARNR